MKIYAGFELPNGSKHIRLPLSVEMLQELGVADGAADFESKVYDCGVICRESDIYVPIPDGSSIEDFNRAARALENAVGCFGNELSFLYREVYHTREMTVANLEEMTKKVVEVCGAATYEGLAEHYIAMGAFGELSDDLYKWLDLYKMGDSIAVKDKLIRGFHGFYKVRE